MSRRNKRGLVLECCRHVDGPAAERGQEVPNLGLQNPHLQPCQPFLTIGRCHAGALYQAAGQGQQGIPPERKGGISDIVPQEWQ